MKKLLFPGALSLIISAAIALSATPEDEILSRLQSALAKEAKEREAAHQGTTDYSNVVARIQMAVDSARWQDASMQLNFIVEGKHSPEIVNICRELRSQLLLEVANREDAVVNRIDDAVKKAGQACLDAKNPQDLDTTLRELSELRPGDQTFRPERVRAAYSKLDVALNFVAQWQDYLVKKAKGEKKEASAIIQRLIDHNNVYPVVARSELLDRVEPSPSPAATATPEKQTIKELFAKTKSLDDLDQLVAALHECEGDKDHLVETRALIEQVSMLRTAYAELRAGRYGPAFEFYAGHSRTGNLPNAEYIAPLRQQLLAKLLPHYLNTPEVLQPRPDETTSDFLLRFVREAKEKRNWDLALRLLQTFKTVAYANSAEPAWLSADIAGYSAIVVADKQERAMQFPEAIASYQKALECNGQNLPVDFISQRLTALRKQHPGRRN
ncbi:MAG: hypothetical protein QOE73_1574 [Verrucomicrobiota bacterium]